MSTDKQERATELRMSAKRVFGWLEAGGVNLVRVDGVGVGWVGCGSAAGGRRPAVGGRSPPRDRALVDVGGVHLRGLLRGARS